MVSNLIAEYKDFGASVFMTPDVEEIMIEVENYTLIAKGFCNLIFYASCKPTANIGMCKVKVRTLVNLLEENLKPIGVEEAAFIQPPAVEGAEES